MNKIKNNRGFTLIEIAIVMALIGVFLGAVVSFGGYVYREYEKTARSARMKQEAENVRSLIESDIVRGGNPVTFTDNHGIMVKSKGKTFTYKLKDNAIYRSEAGFERKLTSFPVVDAVWMIRDDMITLSITYRYHNIVTKKKQEQRILKDIDLAEAGGGGY